MPDDFKTARITNLLKSEKEAITAIQGILCTKYSMAWRNAGYVKLPLSLRDYQWNNMLDTSFLSESYSKFISILDECDSSNLWESEINLNCDKGFEGLIYRPEISMIEDFIDESSFALEKLLSNIEAILHNSANSEQEKSEKISALVEHTADLQRTRWSTFAFEAHKLIERKVRKASTRKTLTQWILSAGTNLSSSESSENPHFKFIDNMIDLRDPSSSKLLPYLLTAYTCNTPRAQMLVNRASDKGLSPLERIFSTDYLKENTDVELEAASNLQKLKNMRKYFSLEGYSLSDGYRSKKEHKVSILSQKDRLFQNFDFVDFIFKAWSVALADCDYKSGLPETAQIVRKARSTIDPIASYELMLYHLNKDVPDRYKELLNENADNKRVLDEFRNELTTYYF